MKKKMLNNKSGITLIALVVTIVVLLILAGVSISMLTGENGIITQAQKSKENTRGADVKETVDMDVNENKILDYPNTTGTKKTRQEVIDKLKEEGKLTDKEVEQLQTVDKITIGEIEVDFSGLGSVEGTTINDIYSEEIVGTVIKNTTLDAKLPEGTDNSWIILGKDKDGSIMLTTSKPIENGFTLNNTVEAWLYYEDGEGEKEQYNLNKACSIYGGTIQNQEIKSRSITLEDVNRVTGFVEPTFNTYTFGNTLDFANKKVDYYHPDSTSDAFWSKNEITYECDDYYYGIDTSSNTIKYIYEGTNWSAANYTGTLKNTNLILGDSLDYFYLLPSRSVAVHDSFAVFNVAGVGEGNVGGGYILCMSGSGSFQDNGGGFDAVPVRPIINLPSNIKVDQVSGEWTIID